MTYDISPLHTDTEAERKQPGIIELWIADGLHGYFAAGFALATAEIHRFR
jgi:acyl dehydratase